MAKEISTKFSVDLSLVISSSLEAVRAIRKREQAEKEAEFQRAIANGLSYEEQIKIRQEQLVEEKKSFLSESSYIASLEKSIAETKRLNRFNKYRLKYAESLGSLGAGKINEEQYLSILENQLGRVTDPDLRLEIQGDISAAETQVKTYNDTILSNQVKKAKYDGTKSVLDAIIARINGARVNALINNNEDEVTAYDLTLSALQSQLSTVLIQDSITDFQVKSSTRGTNPIEKLNFMNSQMQGANADTPIKIGERTFTSAQQFWSLERDNFLAGNSEVFGNFFEELQVSQKNVISVNTSKFGYPTQSILDETILTFKDLSSRPEMAPFLNRIEITQASVMTDAVDKLATAINAIGTNNLTFKEADIQLQNIEIKYGVNVSTYRLQLDEQLRALARAGIIEAEEAERLAPDIDIKLPKVGKEAEILATPTAPTISDITPTIPKIVPGMEIPKVGEVRIMDGIEYKWTAAEKWEPLLQPSQPVDETIPEIVPGMIIPGEGEFGMLDGKKYQRVGGQWKLVTPVSEPTIEPPVEPAAEPEVTPEVSEQKFREIIVKEGDTISGILFRESGVPLSRASQPKYDEVARLSGISDPSKIKIGQTIKIPI